MKYYNILYLIDCNFPHIHFYCAILLFILLIILLYCCILITLREIQFKFFMLFSKTASKRFEMKDRKEYINISLYYKLCSVPITILEIAFYFILVILSVFTLRNLRLSTNIDSYEVLYKINHSLPITKLSYIILVIFYFYVAKLYIDTFASNLFYTFIYCKLVDYLI